MASCKNNNVKFTKDDLKVGHVVKLRNGEFRMVMPVGKDGTLILAGGRGEPWNYLSSWDDEFYAITQRFYTLESEMTSELRDELIREKDVVAVYGYVRGTCFYSTCGDLSADNREILWERKEPKKMTVKEISNILGYEVEIVAD